MNAPAWENYIPRNTVNSSRIRGRYFSNPQIGPTNINFAQTSTDKFNSAPVKDNNGPIEVNNAPPPAPIASIQRTLSFGGG